MSAAAKLKVVAKDSEEDTVPRESGPSFKWVAIGMFPICGVLISVIWTGASASSADLAATTKNHGERLAVVEVKQVEHVTAESQRLDRLERAIETLDSKSDRVESAVERLAVEIAKMVK